MNKIKVGDTVKRFKGGSHGSKNIGDEWIVTEIRNSGHGAMDDKGATHDIDNLEIVSKGLGHIINNYPLF